MYTNDKNVRITLRLNPDQFNFVKKSADLMGTSPSEFLRMVINMTMASVKRQQENEELKQNREREAEINNEIAQSVIDEWKGRNNRRENEEPNFNDKLQ